MTSEPQKEKDPPKQVPSLSLEVGKKASRKLRARRQSGRSVWFGLGMMGIIGWSVVVPALLGALLGIWLDRGHPGSFSWTLSLLVAGLIIGCFNAWRWVAKEMRAMEEENKEDE